MATELNLTSSDLIEELAENISSSIQKKQAAKSAIPDVYKSGMRGNEVPPQLRNKDTKGARKAGFGKGIDPKKVEKTQRGRNVANDDDDDEQKEVKFKASKVSKSKIIKQQSKQIADLTKRLEALEGGKKKKLSI